MRLLDIDDRRPQRSDTCHLVPDLTSQSIHDFTHVSMVTFKIDWYHGCDGVRTPGVTIINARSMMAVFTFPPSRPHFGLPRTLGHWPPGSRFPHSSLTLPSKLMFVSFEIYIIKVTLLTLLNYWSSLVEWLGTNPMAGCVWPARADLAGETGAGETGAEQHVVPPGYWYPDLDGFIIFCFATSIPQGKCWLRCFSRVNMLWTPWHRF